MSRITFLAILLSLTFLVISCKDDEQSVTDYDYHAHIHSPDLTNKSVGDSIHIHVEFESHTGEPVHHVNVKIYNKSDSTEIYNEPEDAHVHATEGLFELHDDLILSTANGVSENTDWVIEAKVWGHGAEIGEVIETIEFHINP